MSARKPKPAKRAPRRKAGRRTAPKAKRKISFRLVVEAQAMIVRYTPNWSDGEFAQGMFEFNSPHKPPRRIAISETGYRCHFAPMEDVKAARSPQSFAHNIVLALLANGKGTKSIDHRQLCLFR